MNHTVNAFFEGTVVRTVKPAVHTVVDANGPHKVFIEGNTPVKVLELLYADDYRPGSGDLPARYRVQYMGRGDFYVPADELRPQTPAEEKRTPSVDD